MLRLSKTQIVRINFLLKCTYKIYSIYGQLFLIRSLLEHVMPFMG